MNFEEKQASPTIEIEAEEQWKQKRCFELVQAIAHSGRTISRVDRRAMVCEAWFLELERLIPETFPQGDK